MKRIAVGVLAVLMVVAGTPLPFTQHQTWFGAGRAEAASVAKQIVATGGTVTTVVQNGVLYKVHTFTSSGTFRVASGSGKVWYLVVAG
ncbi:MAG: hypothetical protein AAB794_04135, partial [Patescibacteria group bacterium]